MGLTKLGPKLILVNDVLVIDKDSLLLSSVRAEVHGEIVDEDASLRYVTSASFRNRIKSVARWSVVMEERFFKGSRMKFI